LLEHALGEAGDGEARDQLSCIIAHGHRHDEEAFFEFAV
jgi:hypothetical protein